VTPPVREALDVWPANLPPGARWLPYQTRRHQPASSLAPPETPPAAPAPRNAFWTTVSRRYWRVLLAAAAGGGLIGIGGGMFLGMVFGAH